MRLTDYYVASESIYDAGVERRFHLLYNTLTEDLIEVSEGAFADLQLGSLNRLGDDALKALTETNFVVPSDADELAGVLLGNKSEIKANDTLYHVIQPTAYCQLGCGYCGQVHTKKRLSENKQAAILESIRNDLSSGKRYTSLQIGWFGGEPLAGLAELRRLSKEFLALAKEFGCEYSAKIVTNGLALTPATAKLLIEQARISSFEITLDGTATTHDARRHTKFGGKTFDKILSNLVALCELNVADIKIIVRCNVDRENADDVSGLIDVLAEKGLQKHIGFYVAPVHAWGNDAHKRALDMDEFSQLEINWCAQLILAGFNVGLLPTRKKIVCMAVREDSRVIDASGNQYTCTEVPYVPAYGTPEKVIGSNLSEIHDPFDHQIETFSKGISQNKWAECATCKMLPVCGGACPKSWLEGHQPCPSVKFNIQDRLILMYATNKLTQEGANHASQPL